LSQAVGLLMEEMRRLGSLIMAAADATAVPAGTALAVDREALSAHITTALCSHPRITMCRDVVAAIPAGPCIIATGPLTAEELSATRLGHSGGEGRAERAAFTSAGGR